MYARVPQVMAQFVLKIEKLSHIRGPTPILETARAHGLRPRLWLLCQPIIWRMAAILRDSTVVVVVVVVRTRPRAIPLAMTTMKKLIHGFPSVFYMFMGLRLAGLRAAGAPL